MLKKLSLTLILLLLLGCTNMPFKNSSLSPKEQLLEQKINNWELDEAKGLFSQMSTTLDPKKLDKYENLISEREQGVKDLKKLINVLKTAFSKNQIFIIERYTDRGIKNKIKLNELKKMDLSNGNIYTTDPKFNENYAEILALINFYDESLYLDIVFNFKDGQWKITDFNERG
ncbi:hypothetical protein [Psychrilyobacter atlanticus]|uniref:hypothetical protein n=1 Tax=Psychrilyobacter atlanticus TaxID=271091 RepID=UPI0004038AFE|nr:hypothetical protein [Psychrilyobacter atlanticus]